MKILKFPIDPTQNLSLSLPRGAQILCVQVYFGSPYIWVLCDPTASKETRTFSVYETGHETGNTLKVSCYIGTFQADASVFHLFEHNRLTS